MIPQGAWKWGGYSGHYICGHMCRFHLCTCVGKFLISTVGCYIDKGEMIEIGCDRFYETYVFKLNGDDKSCGCPDFAAIEIEGRGYGKDAKCMELNNGHLEMCMKYAEMQ